MNVAARCRHNVSRRLLPFLFVAYIAAYLDRANVAFANLYMSADLGFSPAVFGFGAGVFFIGYFILEIPGALIVERWSARLWIARILITWGLCTVLMAFVHTATQFYVVRFLIGCAEAGFFPGVMVYLTHWFVERDRARAAAAFVIAAPISLVIGAPLSAAILHAAWPWMAAWRWMFILEGIPAIGLGFVALWAMTDSPKKANWLPEDERLWLVHALQEESERKKARDSHFSWRSFARRDVLLLASAHLFATLAGYAFIFWLPANMRQTTHFSPAVADAANALPFAAAVVALWFAARSSDRTGERKAHACIPMLVGATSMALTAIPNLPDVLALTFLTLAGAAAFAWIPGFWMLPTLSLSRDAAAASIGFINAVGNLGGFFGPYITGLLRSHAPPRIASAIVVVAAYLISAAITWRVPVPRDSQQTRKL